MLYFEDFSEGKTEKFGSYRVTRDEVIDFASRFDPQPFHLDDLAAAANPVFGRLAASGWHTAAMVMRMITDHAREVDARFLASPGIDELRWISPVYPGDALRVETEVISTRASKSKPKLGLIVSRVLTFNQHDELVMSHNATIMVARRPEDS